MKKIYILLSVLMLLILLSKNTLAESEEKTDLKIITSLDHGGYITPALVQNMTFVYNNFEFHLYTNQNNTRYDIVVDNITIANKTINNFHSVFYWKATTEYIGKLEVNIGNDYYIYSNIFIFTSSITNDSILKEEEYIKFTEVELEEYVNKIKLKLFSADTMGWFVGLFLAQVYVRQYKSNKIEEIE